MKKKPDVWTLTQAARVLGEPQHRLIYLCEKGVIEPDFQDAKGRGSSRRFSARNLLEFAIALRLRELDISVTFVGAVIHVLRAFERSVSKQMSHFKLPDSLRNSNAPDFRIVIADGGRLYFTLAGARGQVRIFGGIALQDAARPSARALERALGKGRPAPRRSPAEGLGGAEGSRFLRLELSVTELACELVLEGS
ncbi:MAG: hypothetical protein AB7T31_10285 [Gemmatimonadales bacterium]